MTTVLATRLDSDGDVLLTGPALRAVAASADRLVLLAGPRGAAAARLLPGVDEVLVWRCPWIDGDPEPVDPGDVTAVVARLQEVGADRALVFGSFHQSPLPTALLLRLAGVPWVGAASDDYPGSLLDLRHRLPETGLHEVQRQLSLAEAAGCALPPGDDGRLAVRRPLPDVSGLTGDGPYVVVHPGASVPSRQPSAAWSARLVQRLAQAGHRVLVTGGPGERALTARVAATSGSGPGGSGPGGSGPGGTGPGGSGPGGTDLGGATDLAGLAAVLAGAQAVVVGNTGPAHLAAAVGTPVVSLFAPVVPSERWQPYGVPVALLGDQGARCRDTRARSCPVPGHPCLDGTDPDDVVAAVAHLTATVEVHA